MDKIFHAISEYGLKSVIIALMINLLTGIVKFPIKKWQAG